MAQEQDQEQEKEQAQEQQEPQEVTNEQKAQQWRAYAGTYMVAGNELLAPIGASGRTMVLDPEFWMQMPIPNNEHGEQGLMKIRDFLHHEHKATDHGKLEANVDYGYLFRPSETSPEPHAAPWESSYDENIKEHTKQNQYVSEMKHRIQEVGLEIGLPAGETEDQIGVELLYLSFLSQNVCNAYKNGEAGFLQASLTIDEIWDFLSTHLLRWVPKLRERVDAAAPKSLYSGLLEYTQGMLEEQLKVCEAERAASAAELAQISAEAAEEDTDE